MGKAKDAKRQKLTRHHRMPRFLGGKLTPRNKSMVPDREHKAYHVLFAWAHPAAMVAAILNAKWLCQEETLVPVPTEKLPQVLKYLKRIGSPVNEEEIGITDDHRVLFRPHEE